MPTHKHAGGYCTCRKVKEQWERPKHWSRSEVAYLQKHYGRKSDAAIAKALGRSLDGVDVKAGRLGLRKRDGVSMSARSVAEIFGVDSKLVARWVHDGLLKARRGYVLGQHPVWSISGTAVGRFMREHPEYVDVAKMPDSWYRDQALKDRWYSLPEVEALTGHDPESLAVSLRRGVYQGRKRFAWWMVPAAELPRIAANTTRWRRTHIEVIQRERSQQLRERKRRRVMGQAA